MSEETTSEHGGKHATIKARFDLLPPRATALVAECLGYGETVYPSNDNGTPNWHLVPEEDHLNHAMNHLNKYMQRDRSEDHLVHAVTRLMMLLELEVLNGTCSVSYEPKRLLEPAVK